MAKGVELYGIGGGASSWKGRSFITGFKRTSVMKSVISTPDVI